MKLMKRWRNHNYLSEVLLHQLNPLLGTKLGFFVVCSSLLSARSSFQPKRSGTAAQSLVALLVAVLPQRMKCMATEPFRVSPK